MNFAIMLELCLMLLMTHYAQNCVGIIGGSLLKTVPYITDIRSIWMWWAYMYTDHCIIEWPVYVASYMMSTTIIYSNNETSSLAIKTNTLVYIL